MDWFTADLHFGHRWMVGHRGRMWGDYRIEKDDVTDEHIATHDEWLIDGWNDVVGPRDEVWVLGDFSFAKRQRTAAIFGHLHGSKHLIQGNHDPKHVLQLPWASIHNLYERKFDVTQRVVMCHYPLLTWNLAHYGAWMLHGHSHGLLAPSTTTRLDVGVDCHPKHRPFSLDEIAAEMSARSYEVVDHHAAPDSPSTEETE